MSGREDIEKAVAAGGTDTSISKSTTGAALELEAMDEEKKQDIEIVHHDPGYGLSGDAKLQDAVHTTLIEEALATRDGEDKLKLRELVKIYYPGMIFGLLLSLALIMEGMDVGMINNFFGHHAYIQRFGKADPETGEKFISSDWQAGISNAGSAGQIVGLLFNGWATPRYGYRKVYMFGMVTMVATIFVLVFARNLEMLLAGNLLCGIPWGIFQIITTAYAAEIVPPVLRGFLTTWVSMCWGCGSFLAAGILRASLGLPGDTAWRLPYALQWIWPVPLFTVALFAPESPFFLVRKEKYEEAATVIRKIARPGYRTDRMVEAQIELMKQANEMEKLNAKSSSYPDCFRGVNLKRTSIGVMVWLIQTLNGTGMGAYATVFLQAAGMPQEAAFSFNMGIQSTNLVSTGAAMYFISKIGRRPLYLAGIGGMGLIMLIIGILGFITADNIALGIAIMLIFAQIAFKLSLGPCCYTIAAETPSTRVRGQTMVIGRAAYVAAGFALNQLTPRMLNTHAWNWGAKSGLFWMGFDIIFFIYLWFELPETRNRTTAEIEYLFQTKVPARKFKGHQIDPYELAHTVQDLYPAAETANTNTLEQKSQTPQPSQGQSVVRQG